MIHLRTHPEFVPGCFTCKVSTLSYGIVPGAFRDTNSPTMFDKEAIMKQFSDADGNPVFNRERVEDNRSDFRAAQKDFLSYE